MLSILQDQASKRERLHTTGQIIQPKKRSSYTVSQINMIQHVFDIKCISD